MTQELDGVAPAPPIVSLPSVRSWARERAWVVGWWAAGRAIVLVTAILVPVVGPRGFLTQDERVDPFAVLNAWDGRWYRMIASDGYLLVPGRQSDPAFFPLYPALLRVLHTLGLSYEAGGLLLGNVALLGALLAFEALTRSLFGGSFARRATIYIAIFPLGFVFSMDYPEALVLGAIALAALAALRGQWPLAAACASAAALARPQGLFVALPIAACVWRRWRDASPAERGLSLGAALAPVAALGAYPLYLSGVLHDPLAWSRAERGWGRHFSPIGFVHAVTHLPRVLERNPWIARDVVFLAVYLVLLAAARRAGASPAWLASALAIVALPVFSGAFDSIGRFGVLAPPVFWGLAWLGRTPRADRIVRAGCIVLLIAATATIPFVFP